MSSVATLHAVVLLSSLLLFRVSTRAGLAPSGPRAQTQALTALNQGRADDATRILRSQIAISPNSAFAHQFVCRTFYSRTAESEFRRAVDAQPSPEPYIDLAAFYQRQEKTDQCVAAIQSAIRLDRAKDAALVDAANILTDANTSSRLAQQRLMAYLASPAKTDAAPGAKVHVQLSDLLINFSDRDTACRKYQAALALPSSFDPAQKALHALQQTPTGRAIP